MPRKAQERIEEQDRHLRLQRRRPQSSSIDYDEVIRNGAPNGQRSELFQACVWHLAAKGMSVEEIVAELAAVSARDRREVCRAAEGGGRALVREVAGGAPAEAGGRRGGAGGGEGVERDRQARPAARDMHEHAAGAEGVRYQVPLRRVPRQIAGRKFDHQAAR